MDEVAHALGELKGTVAGLATRIDTLASSLDTQREGLERRVGDMEKRTHALEIWRSWLVGASASLMGVVGFLGFDRIFRH